jgi:TPR repeat protein
MEVQMNDKRLLDQASEAWAKGRNKIAFALFRKAAHLEQGSAQHNLGYFYNEGVGVRKNPSKALYWYKRAWRNDRQTGTCANIALLCAEQGKYRRAVMWWMKAVSRGDGDAALDLAQFYISRNREAQRRQGVRLLKRVEHFRRVTPSPYLRHASA